jgi:hypothetical protein
LASDFEGENLKRDATVRSTPGSVAMGCATTTKEDTGGITKMLESADIAQLLIFRQGNFLQENFLRRSTFNTSEPNSPSTPGCKFHLRPNV